MSATWAFSIAVIALVIGAVCSTLHQSLRTLARSKIEQHAGAGSTNLQARAEKILEDRTGHASSIALP